MVTEIDDQLIQDIQAALEAMFDRIAEEAST